jgi:hypothetical protein
MTLNYEWTEKSEYEANILKPNSEIEKQDYKLAYIDGATAYKQAVEKQIALERTCYQDPLAALVLDELLKSLQTLKPTLNE